MSESTITITQCKNFVTFYVLIFHEKKSYRRSDVCPSVSLFTFPESVQHIWVKFGSGTLLLGDVDRIWLWVLFSWSYFRQIKEAASSTRLVTNKSKTKYLKINISITNLEQNIVKDGQVYEGVHNFRYLGTYINAKKCNTWRNIIKDCCR